MTGHAHRKPKGAASVGIARGSAAVPQRGAQVRQNSMMKPCLDVSAAPLLAPGHRSEEASRASHDAARRVWAGVD